MEQVILMCGPAGSGKSTLARRLEREGYVRLSFDEEAWRRGFRTHPVPEEGCLVVHQHLQRRLSDAVTSGERVVVDTSFWSRAARDKYREFLAPFGVTPVVLHVRTPRSILLSRLRNRVNGGPNDIHVPFETALAYLDGFQAPTSDEGPVRVVSGASDDPGTPVN
ncbi:AAA family ATPase [Oerskovia sp. NPDC060338]|uniref:AAA family ATPase n=1 Tax=Oerskovia sp. NPDC060338 TaxID=3347100 RepID=UPI00364D2DA1